MVDGWFVAPFSQVWQDDTVIKSTHGSVTLKYGVIKAINNIFMLNKVQVNLSSGNWRFMAHPVWVIPPCHRYRTHTMTLYFLYLPHGNTAYTTSIFSLTIPHCVWMGHFLRRFHGCYHGGYTGLALHRCDRMTRCCVWHLSLITCVLSGR